MADLLVVTTKLEATNWALKNVGLTQVSTLEGTIGRDAASVVASIEHETRNLCRKGMWFSRRDVTLEPDEDGFLVLPAATLSMRPPSDRCYVPYSKWEWREIGPVMRQGKVFSAINQSYVFTNSMTVMIYEALAFDDLPDEAKSYIAVFSALEKNRSSIRSDSVTKDLEPLLNMTWLALVDAELENSQHRFV